MKFYLFISFLILGTKVYSQNFISNKVYETQGSIIKKYIPRTIFISDDEISISNFSNGSKETINLIVDRIEEKNYPFEGISKYYYCTTKEEDYINGYQKAIIILNGKSLFFALFATEIDVYKYEFILD